ncbi:PH domain-containing protein [Dysgonomonas sp. 521]|uniref:PH domain-containing protein n=1 Tax=Dysgonomonas sp. 521 TaxID=2302932 RepID=UPI0013D4B22E|nr:PH domain-containing protein [Dysgonomonas sp. 521]NDV94769.1 PH domain-containing protein [Dysgonomonas sp. 521]
MKSYIDKNLQAGETIEYKAHVHWCIFFSPVVLLLVGIHFFPASNMFEHLIGIVALPLGIFTLLRSLYMKIGTHYVVTNKRVILKQGLLSRNAMELMLTKCEGLSINQGLIGRLLGFGTILLTTGGATNVFSYVTDPIEFRNAINAQL